MGAFTVSSSDIMDLGIAANLKHRLKDAEFIAVSAMMANAVNPRFMAIRDTLKASAAADVPHLVMLSNASIPEAADMIKAAGGIAVVIDQKTQGGHASPFVIASQLVDAFAPDAVMAKFEGEKPIFEGEFAENRDKLLRAGHDYDIVTGVRTADTWASMPAFQQATEVPLGAAIGDILGVSSDTPSGVIVLNAAGRKLFQRITSVNSWTYLIEMPYRGKREMLDVGQVPVDFRYHPAVVEEENGNWELDKKRLDQMEVMLNGAIAVVGGDSLSLRDQEIIRRLNLQRTALAKLATPQPAVCL
jgi:hypothetical protein